MGTGKFMARMSVKEPVTGLFNHRRIFQNPGTSLNCQTGRNMGRSWITLHEWVRIQPSSRGKWVRKQACLKQRWEVSVHSESKTVRGKPYGLQDYTVKVSLPTHGRQALCSQQNHRDVGLGFHTRFCRKFSSNCQCPWCLMLLVSPVGIVSDKQSILCKYGGGILQGLTDKDLTIFQVIPFLLTSIVKL